MKKITRALAVCCCLTVMLGFVGCASLRTSQVSSPILDPIKTNLKADIEVGEKITGTSELHVVLNLIKFGGDNEFADGVTYPAGATASILKFLDHVELVKAAAAYKAVTYSDADIIVAPKYEVKVNSYLVYKKIKVTVTGYKGTIKGIN